MSSNRHDAAMCELLKDDPYKTTVFVGALHGISYIEIYEYN